MVYSGDDHTFVILAYKESPYLEECIGSLKKQLVKSSLLMSTSTPCEFIEKIALKHGIPLVVNKGKRGIAEDWNFGYANTATPLVTIAHQDDIYEPAYLKKMLEAINHEKHPLIAFSDYGELREEKRVYKNTLLKVKKILLFPFRFKCFRGSIFVRRRSLSLGSGICCPSVTFVKENLPDVIFEPGYRSDVDWQAWEMISKLKGQFVYCHEPLMMHRIHEDSATTRIIADQQRSVEDFEMFCKFWPTWFAKIIIKFYNQGEKSNQLK